MIPTPTNAEDRKQTKFILAGLFTAAILNRPLRKDTMRSAPVPPSAESINKEAMSNAELVHKSFDL